MSSSSNAFNADNGVGAKRKFNYDETDIISESEPSESGSDTGSEDDESDEEGDVSEVPRRLFDIGWKLLESGDKEKLIKAKSAFEKAIFILLQIDDDLQQLSNKIEKRKNKNDGKVPPGSALVQRTVTNARFLMCQCKVGLSRIYVHYINDRPAQYIEDALALLGEAVLWYPRSVEAHVLTAQLLKYNTCNSYAQLEVIENCYKKAANMVLEVPSNSITSSSSSSTDPMAQLQVLSGGGSSSGITAAGAADELSDADLSASLDLFLLIREKEQCRTAKQQLSLIYLQYYNGINGGKHSKSRLAEAAEMLQQCGFSHRLSDAVFSYPLSTSTSAALTTPATLPSKDMVCGFDNVLPESMLSHLRHVFRPQAPYWKEHDYDAYVGNHSKSVGYFSYLYPLGQRPASNSIEQIIDKIYKQVSAELPVVAAECTVAEWWVHSRPFSNGHQFHYDSDETNTSNGGKPQHPIVTSVIYCTEPEQETVRSGEFVSMGGPTLVTNQTLECNLAELNGTAVGEKARLLADKGWLCHPQYNRMVTFDARYLHGVIPGRSFEYNSKHSSASRSTAGSNDNTAIDGSTSSSSNSHISSSSTRSTSSAEDKGSDRRLTFMVGFWRKICAVDRGANNPGPGQPFPSDGSTYTWPQEMKLSPEFATVDGCDGPETESAFEYVSPVTISPIWQSVVQPSVAENGTPTANTSNSSSVSTSCVGSASAGMPSYDKCFQGF